MFSLRSQGSRGLIVSFIRVEAGFLCRVRALRKVTNLQHVVRENIFKFSFYAQKEQIEEFIRHKQEALGCKRLKSILAAKGSFCAQAHYCGQLPGLCQSL